MNGLSHYRAAEQLLAELHKGSPSPDEIAEATATAQVHATLALAAATALSDLLEGEEAPWKTRMKWSEVVL